VNVLEVIAMGGLGGLLAMAAEAGLSAYRRHVTQRNLAVLTEWDLLHSDPGSGVWRLDPPCGYPHWLLHAPGSDPLGPDGFNHAEPTARFDALDGPGQELPDDSPRQSLVEIEMWARPWIEQVSGGRVVQMVEGWTSYGPQRELHQYAVFARVDATRTPPRTPPPTSTRGGTPA
jgi:hypothetical protein